MTRSLLGQHKAHQSSPRACTPPPTPAQGPPSLLPTSGRQKPATNSPTAQLYGRDQPPSALVLAVLGVQPPRERVRVPRLTPVFRQPCQPLCENVSLPSAEHKEAAVRTKLSARLRQTGRKVPKQGAAVPRFSPHCDPQLLHQDKLMLSKTLMFRDFWSPNNCILLISCCPSTSASSGTRV